MEKQATANSLPFHPILSLEEPEAHLNPNAQRCVYQQLHDAVGQKIVSTHSPYIAGQAELADIRHFSKDGSETRIVSLDLSGISMEERRKIRREVMRTRGELLFARAVVLFEGETEEQALPLFARHHWNKYQFERGVAFVGVGGAGNYFPFIRIFEAFQIRWFIFSDGETKAQSDVRAALGRAGISMPDARVILLPDGHAIESYLVSQSYQPELKAGIIEHMRPNFRNGRHEEAKTRAVSGWSDACISAFLSCCFGNSA